MHIFHYFLCWIWHKVYRQCLRPGCHAYIYFKTHLTVFLFKCICFELTIWSYCYNVIMHHFQVIIQSLTSPSYRLSLFFTLYMFSFICFYMYVIYVVLLFNVLSCVTVFKDLIITCARFYN